MTREIKFRAWDKSDKVMRIVYGISFKRISNKGNRNEDMAELHCSDYEGSKAIILSHFERPLKEIELMQFTGLLDKNGKEIYEGDIVKVESPTMAEWPTQIREVKWWDDGRWSLGFRDARERWEIIGNIYENPELLTPSPKR